MDEYAIRVLPEKAGMRLDLFLLEYSKDKNLGLSRTFIQGLICAGKVTVKNENTADSVYAPTEGIKPHYKIKSGDEIRVTIEDKKAEALDAEDIPLAVVYEDSDLAVIDKPSGLVVHPAPGNYAHTLVNALLFRFKSLSDVNPKRPGIVHRLDKDTSGLLVIAKNNFAYQNLAQQFSSHSIKRKYIAIVQGRMEFDENVVELPIGRHPYKRKNMSVNYDGKSRYARTYYRTLKRTGDSSLLELEPFTGRTHQLRVHLAFLGHPILGDTKYGKNNAFGRLALHAKYLGFIHPRTGKFIEFSSEIPQVFADFINK